MSSPCLSEWKILKSKLQISAGPPLSTWRPRRPGMIADLSGTICYGQNCACGLLDGCNYSLLSAPKKEVMMRETFFCSLPYGLPQILPSFLGIVPTPEDWLWRSERWGAAESNESFRMLRFIITGPTAEWVFGLCNTGAPSRVVIFGPSCFGLRGCCCIPLRKSIWSNLDGHVFWFAAATYPPVTVWALLEPSLRFRWVDLT